MKKGVPLWTRLTRPLSSLIRRLKGMKPAQPLEGRSPFDVICDGPIIDCDDYGTITLIITKEVREIAENIANDSTLSADLRSHASGIVKELDTMIESGRIDVYRANGITGELRNILGAIDRSES